jgi:hypothetical protein
MLMASPRNGTATANRWVEAGSVGPSNWLKIHRSHRDRVLSPAFLLLAFIGSRSVFLSLASGLKWFTGRRTYLQVEFAFCPGSLNPRALAMETGQPWRVSATPQPLMPGSLSMRC